MSFPLCLTLCNAMASDKTGSLKLALVEMISVLSSRGFIALIYGGVFAMFRV